MLLVHHNMWDVDTGLSLIFEFVFQLEEAIFDLLLKGDRQQNISTHQFWVQGMLA